MNAKQLRVLVGIFLVFAGLAALQHMRKPEEVQVRETRDLSLAVNAERVDRIRLRQGTEGPSVELEKREGVWRLPALWDVEADGGRVDRLLKSLSSISGEERANDDTLFGDFGIANAQGLHVTLSQGGQETEHVVLGAKRMERGQMFVRRAESERVFLCDTDLAVVLEMWGSGLGNGEGFAESLNPQRWVDLRLLSFDEGAVSSVEVQWPGQAWAPVGSGLPFPVDESLVSSYRDRLLWQRASGVTEPSAAEVVDTVDGEQDAPAVVEAEVESGDGEGASMGEMAGAPESADSASSGAVKETVYGFENPSWAIRVTTKDGDAVTLTVGRSVDGDGKEWYARRSDRPAVYIVSDYVARQLKPSGERFVGANPLGINRSLLESLIKRTPKETQTLQPVDGSWDRHDTDLTTLEQLRVTKAWPECRWTAGDPASAPYGLDLAVGGRAPVRVAFEEPAAGATDVVAVNLENGAAFGIARTAFDALFAPRPAETSDPNQPVPGGPDLVDGASSSVVGPGIPVEQIESALEHTR